MGSKEMDRRYDILESKKFAILSRITKIFWLRLLKKLKKIKSEGERNPQLPEMMPYIVVVIDELADLMQAYPRELESAIVRLAQMSRAVGIHLMLSPSDHRSMLLPVLSKPTFLSRIALQVTSQIDSRTILDTGRR
jgi:S-DNA-T family DNA segregation ATPase FtsK/SpoIIIE